MGGVVIHGRKGTTKSVMSHALYSLLTLIKVINDSPFNIDPDAYFGVDDFTRTDITKGGMTS